MANQSCGIGCSFQLGFGSSSAGVFIQKVKEDGPAAIAGINAGDRLLGFFLDSKVSFDPPTHPLFSLANRILFSSFPCPMWPPPCP
jgi:hypothetical protein